MIALAMILDAIFGEPDALWRRVPHPVVVIGRAIGWLEARLNRGTRRREKGIALVAGLVAVTAIVGDILSGWYFLGIFEVLLGAVLLAHRSLMDHVRAVARAQDSSLPAGRVAVSKIVGRDTAALGESAVARAAIESAAENFSDGFTAPLFWFVIGGLPGIMVYKAVNTADSMIGYRNERYGDFGWAAARLDDLMNWIPARLTGALICVVGGRAGSFAVMQRDAGLHRSPNAGWPEAAVAASLGIAVSGPRVYEGRPTDDPFVNPEGRRVLSPEDIRACCRLLWRVWAAVLGIVLLLGLIL